MLRYPHLALIPAIGDGSKYRMNFVPRDFVVDAIAHLSALEVSQARVYHLTDPAALTVDELVAVMGRATGANVVRVAVPYRVARQAFALPFVRNWTRIDPEAIDYFIQAANYTCDHTLHDLRGSGISCPPFHQYVDRLVRFMRQHPDITPDAMI